MIVSINEQALMFLLTVGTGMLIGFIYDLFRILRKIIPHSDIVTNIEDLVFWILGSLVLFYILFSKNYGEIRGFALLGAALGIGFYFLTVSPLFMSVALTILHWIKKIVLFIIKIMLFPIRIILRILSYPYRGIHKILKIWGRFIGKRTKKATNFSKRKIKKAARELSIIVKKV